MPSPLRDRRASTPPCSALVALPAALTANTGSHRRLLTSAGHPATPRGSSDCQTPPPTRSAWTSPLRATGGVTPTTGQSSLAPCGTPALLATYSLLGPAGPPSSARSASSFLSSRRAPAALPVAPTWLSFGRPADRTEARLGEFCCKCDSLTSRRADGSPFCLHRDDVTLEESSAIGSAASSEDPHPENTRHGPIFRLPSWTGCTDLLLLLRAPR